MWGERFFHTRDRLAACRARIESLAGESGLSPRESEEAAAELGRRWLGGIVGEVNAGKSALLNALAGAKLAEVAPVPTTRGMTAHVGPGFTESSALPPGCLVEVHQAPGLDRIGWIDTPGLNGPQREEMFAALADFERLDVLLVVFPADNTWTAATWEWLSMLGDETLERTALVVQMADKKGPEDLRVIRGHMTDLTLKKIGRKLPILILSALPPGGAPELRGLEEFLEDRMCLEPGRRHLLDRAFHESYRRMREIEDGLDRQKRGMADDGWFLGGLEREGEQLRDLLVESSADELDKQLHVYGMAVEGFARELRRKMGLWGTFKGLLLGDAAGGEAEVACDVRLKALVSAFAARDLERIFAECSGHWGAVRPRVIERMGFDPGEMPPMLASHREQVAAGFDDRVGRAVPEYLGGLRLRVLIDGLMRQRSRRLRGWFGFWLVLVTLMGICGSFGLEPWTGWLVWAVVAGALLLGFLGWLTRRTAIRGFKDRLIHASGRFGEALRKFHTEAIREVFEGYGQGLISVRRRLADRQAELGPLAEKWNTLYLELKTIEQEWSG
ncbi:MAG: 50S ribosome-binding GTPase [Akkermansiaceae bacterium]|jgi:hypothetical protein|nr:50S ribosome-binding GTPase [Akkermansiaceae bacterium]